MNDPSIGRLLTGFRRVSIRITVIYLVVGGAWILFSDRLLAKLVADPALLTRFQTVKGWFFVTATALFLYWMINRDLAIIERAGKERGETEARFQLLFQTAPVSIWETDLSEIKDELDSLKKLEIRDYGQYLADRPEFVQWALQKVKILDINETTLALVGAQRRDELLGALDKVVVPEALPAFRDWLEAVAVGKEYFEAELPILTLQRECKSVLVSLAIPSEREKFRNLPISVMDVTERKRTEEMLRLLESAVQQTWEAITITTARLDPPGPEIVYVNPAFTRITGYAAKEVIGKTPRILQGLKTERTVLDRMRASLWQRQTFHGETINYRKDGTDFIMEWYVAPLMNRKAQVTHFVAVQRDVTEQRQREEALRESEALLSVIFDQAFQLMGLMKPDGTLIKINRTASDFIKDKDAKVLDKPFWETPWWAHSPEQQERLKEAVRAAARGEFVRFEATHLTPEGRLVYVDFSLKPVRDEEGNVLLLVPEGRDITERKLAEEEIKKLNKDLQRRAAELEEAYSKCKELSRSQ